MGLICESKVDPAVASAHAAESLADRLEGLAKMATALRQPSGRGEGRGLSLAPIVRCTRPPFASRSIIRTTVRSTSPVTERDLRSRPSPGGH